MNKNHRKCLACGKEYDFCPRCEAGKETPWMTTFDCVECREIFNVVSGYNMGILTLNDVQNTLKKLHIEDVTVYRDEIKDVLKLASTQTKETVKEKNVDIELNEKKTSKKPIFKGDVH